MVSHELRTPLAAAVNRVIFRSCDNGCGDLRLGFRRGFLYFQSGQNYGQIWCLTS